MALPGVDGLRALEIGTPGQMRQRLNGLILDGMKRATAGLQLDYERAAQPLEYVGERLALVDDDGQRLAIVEVTRVETTTFAAVPWEFAEAESEGDRSIDEWRDGHWRFWTSQGERIDDDTPVVLVWFVLLERIEPLTLDAGASFVTAPSAFRSISIYTPTMAETEERALAVSLYNRCWELLETEERSTDGDVELITCALASRHHGHNAGGPQEWIISDWMVARAVGAVGACDLALVFALRANDAVTQSEFPDWLVASTAEGVARAYGEAGRAEEFNSWFAKAQRLIAVVVDDEDRELIARQLGDDHLA